MEIKSLHTQTLSHTRASNNGRFLKQQWERSVYPSNQLSVPLALFQVLSGYAGEADGELPLSSVVFSVLCGAEDTIQQLQVMCAGLGRRKGSDE